MFNGPHAPSHTLAQTVRACLGQNSPPYTGRACFIIQIIHPSGTQLGIMPPQSAIPSSIRTISSTGAPPHSHRLSSIPGEATPNPSIPPQASIGYGIPSVPAKVKEKILAGEYIDFTELPPAKGKALLPSTLSSSEGSLLLINSADLHQHKRFISDLGVWIQCFAIYMGIICSQHPHRLPDLLGYMCQISRASQRYKWPSWVVFDQNFRQLVADQGLTSLAHLDTTLYTQCFSGQAKEGQSWCQYCHSLDHASISCPLKPRPTKSFKVDTAPAVSPTEICNNFNFRKGCKFGKRCLRLHKCRSCGGPHAQIICPSSQSQQQRDSSQATHPR